MGLRLPGLPSTLPTKTQDPSVPMPVQILRGVGAGLLNTPVVGSAAQELLTAFPEIEEQDVQDFLEVAESTPAGKIASIGTQIGTTFVGGGLVLKGGRALGRGAMALLSAGRTEGQLGQVASFLAGAPMAVPGALRAAEIGATAGAFGTLSGVDEALKGGDAWDVARSAAIGAALSAGVDTALYGAGRAFGRDIFDVRPIVKQLESNPRWMEWKGKTATHLLKRQDRAIAGIEAQKTRISAFVNKAMGVPETETEMALMGQPTLPGMSATKIPFSQWTDAEKRRLFAMRQGLRNRRQALRRVTTEMRGFMGFLKEEVTQFGLRSRTPLNPSDRMLQWHQFSARYLKSPETLGSELGVPGRKITQLAIEAGREDLAFHSALRVRLGRVRDEAAAALGMKRRPRDGRFLSKWVDLYETQGLDALRQMNPRLASIFEQDIIPILSKYGDLAKMGAEAPLTQTDLVKAGVRNYFPHVMDFSKGSIDDWVERMAAALQRQGKGSMTMDQARVQAHRILSRQMRGLRQFGSIDHQRYWKGSLASKLAEGAPFIDDPLEALEVYGASVGKRIAWGRRFGFNGELRAPMLGAIQAGGGNVHIGNTFLDSMLSRDVGTGANHQLASLFTNFQAATKLTTAALPNATQSLNTVIVSGFKNFSQGMGRAIGNKWFGTEDEILTGLAIQNTILNSVREGFLEPSTRNWLARFSNFMLNKTGFTWTERWNRVFSAAAGEAMYIDDLEKAVLGRARGATLNNLRRRWSFLDMDLDATVAKVRSMGPSNEVALSNFRKSQDYVLTGERMAYNMARKTQFLRPQGQPNISLPPTWNTPIGRVMTQFKSFAFNQAKMVRDWVLAEARQGNITPMAYYLSVYPVAGEVIGDTRAFIKDVERDQEGLARYFNNIMMVGGLGLVTDSLVGAQYGNFLGFLAGPTFNDAAQITQYFASGEPERVWKWVERQPIYRTTNGLMREGLELAE